MSLFDPQNWRFFLSTAKRLVPGGGANKSRSTFPEQPTQAAHKGVHKGTLIDDFVWPEENDIRRRFRGDEGAAFTLLCLSKIDEYASEASTRESAPYASGQ